MSKYLNHNELIGSYLEGSMSPDEMLGFENQLHTDPVLRSEFELQQDIVNSLQDFRKTQLKARLDQVPVSMSPTGILGVKTAAAIVLTGIIGIGAYLFYASQIESVSEPMVENNLTVEETNENAVPEFQATEPSNLEEEIAETVETPVLEESTSLESTIPVESPAANNKIKENIVDTQESGNEPVETPQPVVNSPEVIDPSLEEGVHEEVLEIPTSALAQKELGDNPVLEIETTKKDSELFHYQYYSGKLYLYGDFRDNPYEILELNSASGKKLFMFYNQEYFQILDDQVDLTPLQKLQDRNIIRELDIIKENK